MVFIDTYSWDDVGGTQVSKTIIYVQKFDFL